MPTAAVLQEIRRATRPHGVATIDAFDLSVAQLQRCCRAGALVRAHPGVYVDPATPETPRQRLAVAVAAAGPRAAAWGRSAAALWKMVPEFPETPEVVVPRQRRAGVLGAVVHRSTDLCPAHVTVREHIRTVNPLVTVLDLGVVLGAMEIAEVVVNARQQKLFEPAAIEATLARLARCGRTGVKNARHAMQLVMIGDRPADSVLELRFHHGPGRIVPPYEYQWQVMYGRKTYYIDFAYPSVKLAIEVDGYETRRSRASFDRDAERQNNLVLDGWRVLRITWTRLLHDPSGVAADIMALLGTLGFAFRS